MTSQNSTGKFIVYLHPRPLRDGPDANHHMLAPRAAWPNWAIQDRSGYWHVVPGRLDTDLWRGQGQAERPKRRIDDRQRVTRRSPRQPYKQKPEKQDCRDPHAASLPGSARPLVGASPYQILFALADIVDPLPRLEAARQASCNVPR
jgi:hypothetical protein